MARRRSVMWFRRDLRLADHPALTAAVDAADEVVPLVVLDRGLLAASPVRADRFLASVAALNAATGGALVVRGGDPREVVPAVAAEAGADTVHVSAETHPYGRRRDAAVERALDAAGRNLVRTGSPYAVGPGTIRNGSGEPYKVFTPFSRAWRGHGWPDPPPAPEVVWAELSSDPDASLPDPDADPTAGERATRERWRRFVAEDVGDYARSRDRADLDTTSRMSAPLKYGEIHPRTMLADLIRADDADPDGAGAREKYATEICWRDFYADVLWHSPRSAWHDLRDQIAGIDYDSGAATDELVEAWRQGRTGFPYVDAGMRQLVAEHWMHNRVRMVTASFLVKDLHVWWPVGARHFLDRLADGDVASNNHGWQWVAGTGTDAAPYFRVFNPVSQGLKFDPDGSYVRRWVPELRHLPGKAAHQPWDHAEGYAHGYPERIVDHAEERRTALDRYQRARG